MECKSFDDYSIRKGEGKDELDDNTFSAFGGGDQAETRKRHNSRYIDVFNNRGIKD